MTEETPASNPPNEQTSVEVIPTSNPSNEQTSVEVVADPECIVWKYPPYCELCNSHFNCEENSKKHFDGQNHKNKLHLYLREQDSEPPATTSKNVLCRVCWKEMNTQLIFDSHCKSPAHAKEVKKQLVIQKLKEDYRQLKELHQTNS